MSSEADTKTRILAATRRLLEDRGAAATRLADVAKAAGVSRQAVYLHFGSRSGLLVALVDEMDRSSGLYDRLAEVAAAPDGVTALRRALAITAWYAPIIRCAAMALYLARDTDEAARAAYEDRMQSRLASFLHMTRQIAEEGRLAPGWTPEAAAEAVWALGIPPVHEALVAERGWSTERYLQFLEHTASAFLRGGVGV